MLHTAVTHLGSLVSAVTTTGASAEAHVVTAECFTEVAEWCKLMRAREGPSQLCAAEQLSPLWRLAEAISGEPTAASEVVSAGLFAELSTALRQLKHEDGVQVWEACAQLLLRVAQEDHSSRDGICEFIGWGVLASGLEWANRWVLSEHDGAEALVGTLIQLLELLSSTTPHLAAMGRSKLLKPLVAAQLGTQASELTRCTVLSRLAGCNKLRTHLASRNVPRLLIRTLRDQLLVEPDQRAARKVWHQLLHMCCVGIAELSMDSVVELDLVARGALTPLLNAACLEHELTVAAASRALANLCISGEFSVPGDGCRRRQGSDARGVRGSPDGFTAQMPTPVCARWGRWGCG